VYEGVWYAGFWVRLVAFIIDAILILIIFSVTILLPWMLYALYYVKNTNDLHSLDIPISVGGTFEGWLYESIFLSSKYMATPGKMLLGLKVTDMNGNRITFLVATWRYIFKNGFNLIYRIPCIGLVYLINMISPFFIPFTEKKQALHDIIAETVVTYDDYGGRFKS